jgi:hypothetical protein
MSFIKINKKVYLIIILIIICVHSTLNNKIKTSKKIKAQSKSKNKNKDSDYFAKMKEFFELVIDKKIISEPDQKKCWDWIWESGVEINANIKSTIKKIRETQIKTFLVKSDSTSINAVNALKELIEATGEFVKIEAEENVPCKEFLTKAILTSVNFSTNYYHNKMKSIFNILINPAGGGDRKFITSAASVHRNNPLRSDDLFQILNNN